MVVHFLCCTTTGEGFPSFLFFTFFIKDERYATQYMGRFVVYLKFLFVFIGVVSFAFIIIYKYELSERGYTSCNGIPLGWMLVWQKNMP